MARTSIRVVMATAEHAHALAPRMRLEDARECQALGFSGPLDALVSSLEASVEAWALYLGGELAALYGVADPQPESILGGPGPRGVVWALTGEACSRYPLAFVRASREMLDDLLQRWGSLHNAVDTRYRGALRWLDALGFAPAGQETTVRGVPFVHATISRRHG